MRRALGLMVAAVSLAIPATALGQDSVTLMNTGPQPVQRTFLADQDTFVAGLETLSSKIVSVAVTSGADTYWLRFGVPGGGLPTPGIYHHLSDSGSPTGSFSADGRAGDGACYGGVASDATVDLRDIAVDPDGTVRRLWMLWEQHCGPSTDALFGEVRIGEPATADGWQTAPSTLRWPATDLGADRPILPVTIAAADTPAVIGSVRLSGPDADAFAIVQDGCGGRRVAPHASCIVSVALRPHAAGTAEATLAVTDDAGVTSDVALQGFSYGGRTRLVTESDVGDYIGGGLGWDLAPPQQQFTAYPVPNGIAVGVSEVDVTGVLTASFAMPSGGPLLPGTYLPAARYPFNGARAGLDVSGYGRGCNILSGRFVVHAAAYSSRGELRSLSVGFIQHCEEGGPALRGLLEWRAGDQTLVAPWMSPDSASDGTPGPAPGLPTEDETPPAESGAGGGGQGAGIAPVNDPVAPVASESPSEAPLAGPPPAASTPATPSPQRGAAPTARARIIRSGRLSIHASLPTAAAGSVRVEVRGRLHGRAVVYVTAVRVRAGRVTATVVLPRRLRGVRVSGVRLRYRDGAGRARTVRARG